MLRKQAANGETKPRVAMVIDNSLGLQQQLRNLNVRREKKAPVRYMSQSNDIQAQIHMNQQKLVDQELVYNQIGKRGSGY